MTPMVSYTILLKRQILSLSSGVTPELRKRLLLTHNVNKLHNIKNVVLKFRPNIKPYLSYFVGNSL